MSNIVELRPRSGEPAESPGDGAIGRLIGPLHKLIGTLEASHLRIGALIGTIPDPEVARRLGRDLAMLSASLRDAKTKVAALTINEPGNEA